MKLDFLVIHRILVKVFHVYMVGRVERFMKRMTTAAVAQRTTLENIARKSVTILIICSYVEIPTSCSFVAMILLILIRKV